MEHKNTNIRYYGKPPYLAAAVHGGPGGIGSANGLARGLAEYYGVVEPLQGTYSVEAQAGELYRQLSDVAPLVLIGHSWGAWLAVIAAARYPGLARQLVLVGSGALEVQYLPQLVERRLAHFDEAERKAYFDAIDMLEQDSTDKDVHLQRLGRLADKADTYSPLETECEPVVNDGRMYAEVWPQAAEMRKSGELLSLFRRISCPLTVIHGDYDTTPPEGVTEPLERAGIPFTPYILKNCGHTPWRERYARDDFFQTLKLILDL